MPDSNQSQTPTPLAPAPSSPPPSGTVTSPPAEYRFPADATIPEYARGRTATEVLGLTQKLVERFIPPTSAPQPPPQQAAVPLDPEGYVTGRDLANAQQEAIRQYQPQVQAGIDLAASANYGLIRNQYAKEFSKYGPEIVSRLAGVPKNVWTLDNLETVVKLVRADHFDDYRAEWQTEAASKVDATIRSGGAGGALPVTQDKTNSLESEKIPAEWKLRAQTAGLTEATVREFCHANEITEAQFYKQFDNPMNQIVAEVQSGR